MFTQNSLFYVVIVRSLFFLRTFVFSGWVENDLKLNVFIAFCAQKFHRFFVFKYNRVFKKDLFFKDFRFLKPTKTFTRTGIEGNWLRAG